MPRKAADPARQTPRTRPAAVSISTGCISIAFTANRLPDGRIAPPALWLPRRHYEQNGCMANLIATFITSLDGYVADAEGNFDWSTPSDEVHTFVNDLERSVGT